MNVSRVLRVYLAHPIEPYLSVPARMWNPIARAQMHLQRDPALAPRLGARATHFRLTPDPEEADFHLLPFLWRWYLDTGQVELAARGVDTAHRMGKEIVLFNGGDFPARLPFSGVMLFQAGGYRSRRFENGNRVYAHPAFIDDFLHLYNDGHLDIRTKGPRPVVGFCGLAGGRPHQLIYRTLKLHVLRAAHRLGLYEWEPPPFEPTRFRRRVLRYLEEDPRVETRFVIRYVYRAGYKNEKGDPFHPTRLEYVDNLRSTDYTVAVRGRGNFSVRFYETLAMGRIPIFVDTDCILPFDDFIPYREYMVWVDAGEIARIGDRVVAFHERLSAEEFGETQRRCRRLWEEWLSPEAFWRQFWRHFVL